MINIIDKLKSISKHYPKTKENTELNDKLSRLGSEESIYAPLEFYNKMYDIEYNREAEKLSNSK